MDTMGWWKLTKGEQDLVPAGKTRCMYEERQLIEVVVMPEKRNAGS